MRQHSTRDHSLIWEKRMKRLTVVSIILLIGCGSESGPRPDDSPGVLRGKEAREFLENWREKQEPRVEEAARRRVEEARAKGAAEIARSNDAIEILDRAIAAQEAMKLTVAALPTAYLTEREVYLLQQSLNTSRAANRDLREIGLETSDHSITVAEEELAHHREVAILRADAENLTQEWARMTHRLQNLEGLSSAELSVVSRDVNGLIIQGNDLVARVDAINRKISQSLRSPN